MLKALLKKKQLVYNAKQMIYAVSIALDNLLHFPPIRILQERVCVCSDQTVLINLKIYVLELAL